MTTPTDTADDQTSAEIYEKTARLFKSQSFVDEWNRTGQRMKEKESPEETRIREAAMKKLRHLTLEYMKTKESPEEIRVRELIWSC